jgi:aryl-alcohol dehydrogenase-like predicted oxidoreductase
VQVSEIGLGGNMFGGKCDIDATFAIIGRALELGVNFIDTAEGYTGGKSEELIGKVLAGRRHDVVLATKTGYRTVPQLPKGGRLTRRRIIESVESSLRRLATDYVDVYYFHYPDPLTPLEESLRAMDDLVTAGKIRYPACSNYAAWELVEMVDICERRGYALPATSQMPYNLLERSIEKEMVPACHYLGISIIPYSPLAGGFLTGKYRPDAPPPKGSRFDGTDRFRHMLSEENFAALDRCESFATSRGRTVADLAIGWLLAQPVVCSVIAGATTPEQVEQHVQAAEWSLSAQDMRELAQA